MDIFASWDGDHIGQKVGRAVLADDISEVKRIDQAIQGGNEIWKSFADRCGGKLIEMGGDEGRIQVSAEHLGDMADIARQYAEAVGATVSVGVGMKISESAKALLVAKLRGGNQILLWDASMQPEIDEAAAPKSERDKISEEYLAKANKLFRGSGYRHKATGEIVFTGQMHDPELLPEYVTRGGAYDDPEFEKVVGRYEAGFIDHRGRFYTREEAAKAAKLAEPARSEDLFRKDESPSGGGGHIHIRNRPGKVAGTHAGFQGKHIGHRHLSADSEHSQAEVARKTIAAGQAGIDAPEVTHAEEGLEGTLHGLAQAQHKQDGDEAAKQESNTDEVKKRVAQVLQNVRVQIPILQQLKASAPDTYQAIINLVQGVIDLGRELSDGDEPVQKSEKLPGGLADDRNPGDFDPDELLTGIEHEMEHTDDVNVAREIAMDHLSEDPKYYTHLAENEKKVEQDPSEAPKDGPELDKAAIPAHHHLNLPVGSVNNGKVKVRHADGGEGWISVRSGQVQGQEPDAPLLGMNSHPVSAREPGAK